MAVIRDEQTKQIKINKSHFFLTPLLKISNYTNVINSYLGDVNDEENALFSGNIYILCSEPNHFIKANLNYVKDYEVDDGHMYCLSLPNRHKNNFIMFMRGKYSQFDDDAKLTLASHACRNNSKKPKDTDMYAILYRLPKKREQLEKSLDVRLPEDAELASIYNEELEIYGI